MLQPQILTKLQSFSLCHFWALSQGKEVTQLPVCQYVPSHHTEVSISVQ